MKIFIIGASGLVGGNCYQYFKEKGWDVKGSYFSYANDHTVFFNTLDLEHNNNFDIVSWQPDVIVHCGALTHVDYCETHEEESFSQTVTSTANIIKLAKKCNARMVYISTDYVFDGTSGPYTEDAPINPLSIYGKHKLEAEQLVLSEIKNSLSLRVTNIYGNEERGRNFVARIISQYRDGAKLSLKLPFDQYSSPTNAFDIARTMYLLIRDGKHGVYNISGTDYMNRVALALRVLQYLPNAQYELIPLDTKTLNQPALRPLTCGLVNAKFCKEYPDFQFSNIDDYMQSITI